MSDVHAVPVESSAGHSANRLCPCGPVVMRDLSTGMTTVWRHRSPPSERHVREPNPAVHRWSGAPDEKSSAERKP